MPWGHTKPRSPWIQPDPVGEWIAGNQTEYRARVAEVFGSRQVSRGNKILYSFSTDIAALIYYNAQKMPKRTLFTFWHFGKEKEKWPAELTMVGHFFPFPQGKVGKPYPSAPKIGLPSVLEPCFISNGLTRCSNH